MLISVCPRLPMRNIQKTKEYYYRLNFSVLADYGNYLMMAVDDIEVHFFEFKGLNPTKNYGQVYIRTHHIENVYQSLLEKKIEIHPNGALELKPWGQKEFSLLDPDFNLLTFGQSAK